MKTSLNAILGPLALTMALAMSAAASAETSHLKIDGDLMIHPDQIGSFFESAADKISSAPSWDWPELKFSKPYKTAWTQVQARGPFGVNFATEKLAAQELGFEMSWSEPSVTIGKFEINDTIVRKSGTNTIIVHLNGSCTGMVIRFPGAKWKLKGAMKWAWSTGGIHTAWQNFQFSANEQVAAEVDLGQCEGASLVQEELRDTILRMSRDGEWMQDVMRDGILDWVDTTLSSLQSELLKPREIELKKTLAMAWTPTSLSGAGNGMLHIGGQIVLSKKWKVEREVVLARGYSATELANAKESGFILPKETIQAVVDFMQEHRDLGFRVASREVESFTSLMQSRFLQFFVWPDLMKFPKSTNFWFDIGVSQSPKLSDGQMVTGGILYKIEAPLVVNQWAPSDTEYLPYVDFHSQMAGHLFAQVTDNKLEINLRPKKLKLKATMRSEFAQKVRDVVARISTGVLGSRASDYLSTKSFEVEIPVWKFSEETALGVRDLQLTESSLRIPLELKNNK